MDTPYTSAEVERCLYEAGRTLLALRVSGCWPAGFRSSMPEVLREAVTAYGRHEAQWSPATPTPRQVSAMDRSLSWVRLLPGRTEAEIRLRHLVCSRLLVSPRTDRPLYSWRRLGQLAGCSANTAKTRWLDAISAITIALNRPDLRATSGVGAGAAPGAARGATRGSRG